MKLFSILPSQTGMFMVLAFLCACSPATDETTPTLPLPTLTSISTASPVKTAASEYGISSEEINQILKQGPGPGKCLVYGTLLLGEQPIPFLTEVRPDFWVRDENEGNAEEIEEVYDPLTGEFVYTFPVGEFGISADIVLGEVYPSPGDFTSFTVVKVEDPAGMPLLRQDIQLTRIMHMTSPFDNLIPWDETFERVKMWDTPLLESQTVLFEWDAVPEASEYLLTITEIAFNPDKNLPWDNVQVPVDTILTETSLTIELPSTQEDHFYSTRLYARDTAGIYVGNLMFRLKNGGWGWDVRFRVP